MIITPQELQQWIDDSKTFINNELLSWLNSIGVDCLVVPSLATFISPIENNFYHIKRYLKNHDISNEEKLLNQIYNGIYDLNEY